MRSTLVLGSGRSGTSMVAGTLAGAGYHMGDDLYPARAANPKGFYEGPEINGINEALLAPLVPAEQGLGDLQRWLAVLPVEVRPQATPALATRMARAAGRRPFAYKDPRFCYTLPAWRPHLGDAALVCVFRHPAITARSIVEECSQAAYLRHVQVDAERGLAVWAAMYRVVVERLRREGDWLFLHYDQLFETDGQRRLGALLGCRLDTAFPDRHLHRPPPAVPLPEDVAALYGALCELAGYREGRGVAMARRAAVAVLTLVGPTPVERRPVTRDLGPARAAVEGQRGVEATLVVVDHTDEGGLAGAVREPGWSRGRAWKRGLAATEAPYVAILKEGLQPLPSWLAHACRALDARPDVDAVTCDAHVLDERGSFVRRLDLRGSHAAVVLRRAVLEGLDERAFFPCERELLDRSVVHHLDEPLVGVPEALVRELLADEHRDAAVLSALKAAPTTEVALTVLVCTWNRKDTLRECLASFCRQASRRGSYEIVLVDDGSTDGTDRALAGLGFAVPVRILRRENGGLAAARNTGIGEARGRLLLLVNDDTIADVDLVERHVAAHRRLAPAPVAVLGSFVQPEHALENALMRAVEHANMVFCYADLTPGAMHHMRYFYTCNVSVPTGAVRDVGGFDESFRHYGAEDTDLGLRLGRRGMAVVYEPGARAVHRHPFGLDYLERRNPMVARAHVRLFRKHPGMMDIFRCTERTLAAIETELRRHEAGALATLEAARALSATDLGVLEREGPESAALAERIVERLQGMLKELNAQWWRQGFAEGLREHGLASFGRILAERPLAVPGARARAWLLWPAAEHPERWTAVVERFLDAFGAEDDATLLVRADGRHGLAAHALAATLDELAVRSRVRNGREPAHVAVLDGPLPPVKLGRLLAGAAGWVRGGGEGDALVESLAAAVGAREARADDWPAARPGSFRPIEPWGISTAAPWRLLAWPRWSDVAQLETLLALARPLVGRPDVCLCLRHDPDADGDLATAVRSLEDAGGRVLGQGADLEVLMVDDRLDALAWRRLGRAVDAVLAPEAQGADGRAKVLAHLGVPLLDSEPQVAAWTARLDRATGGAAAVVTLG